MSSNEIKPRFASPLPTEPAKLVSNEPSAPISPPLRWLTSCSTLLQADPSDAKDLACSVEVLRDRLRTTEAALCDLENVLLEQVRLLVAKEARIAANYLAEQDALIKAIREADAKNSAIASSIRASYVKSQDLLTKITTISSDPR